MPSRTRLEALRQRYVGKRIELEYTSDAYTNLKPGDQGTVWGVDDIGSLMIKWDSGSNLSMIPGEDRVRIVKEAKQDQENESD